MPPGVRVVPVQLPGRENRWSEPAYVDMGLLVSKLVSVLCPLFEIPYVLFGHSMGGLICFECAQQIQRRNMAPPAHLFISGTRAPHIDNRELPLHILSDAEFLNELFARSGELSNLSSQNRELTKVLLPTIRADFTLCETFRSLSSEPLALPISVYGGKRAQLVVYKTSLAGISTQDVPSNFRCSQATTFIIQREIHFYLHYRESFLQSRPNSLT